MVRATRVSVWSRRYELNVDGRQVSTWDGSWWRSGGTLTNDGRLMDGDRTVGSIRRTSIWRSDVEADLPGLPVPVQVFVVAAVVARWDSESAAGSSV